MPGNLDLHYSKNTIVFSLYSPPIAIWMKYISAHFTAGCVSGVKEVWLPWRARRPASSVGEWTAAGGARTGCPRWCPGCPWSEETHVHSATAHQHTATLCTLTHSMETSVHAATQRAIQIQNFGFGPCDVNVSNRPLRRTSRSPNVQLPGQYTGQMLRVYKIVE